MFKYTGNLNTDIFEDFSSMQANSRIESNYKHNSETFKKMKTPENVRDFLIIFGRHWISGICHDSQPSVYNMIPASFKNGKF